MVLYFPMAMRITSTLSTHLTGGSFLRYEVGDNVRMQMPDAFWGRLQREYGRIRYVQSRGEAAAVVTSCELIIALEDTKATVKDINAKVLVAIANPNPNPNPKPNPSPSPSPSPSPNPNPHP